jgi:hypothetical protein
MVLNSISISFSAYSAVKASEFATLRTPFLKAGSSAFFFKSATESDVRVFNSSDILAYSAANPASSKLHLLPLFPGKHLQVIVSN